MYFDQVYHQSQFIGDLIFWNEGSNKDLVQDVYGQEYWELVQCFNSQADFEILPNVCIISVCLVNSLVICHVIKTKGMVFRYTWVYSKEDTMAHTYRSVVTS